MNSDLIEVRCPYQVINKKTFREFACNRLVVKVSPGASGQGWCNSCRRRFDFQIEGSNVSRVLTEA